MMSRLESRMVELERQNAELRAELENERQRLAACGVAALGYFKPPCHPAYESASLRDTLRLYAEKERLRVENESLRKRVAKAG